MQSHDLEGKFRELARELELELNSRLPRKVGVYAKNHFTDNFRKSGFVDGGLHPWQQAKRQLGSGTSARYPTLTSSRNHLMRSIQSTPGRGYVLITNPVPYASIHNEGGELRVQPTISQQMRKWAWRRYYEEGGKESKEAEKWKGLALTRKKTLTINIKMPQRQFIGESKELREKIDAAIADVVHRINDKIFT